MEGISELNLLHDLRQAVLAVKFAPFSLLRHPQLDDHSQLDSAAEAFFRALGAVPDSGQGAFDRVCNRYADLGAVVRLGILDQGICCDHLAQRHLDDWELAVLVPSERQDPAGDPREPSQTGFHHRHEPTPVDHWHEAIERSHSHAILDRLVHFAHRLQLSGESMRRRATKSLGLSPPT